MNNLKQHIVYRILALMLVVAVTIPSIVKLAHLFENHEHQVCNGESITHIHSIDVNCEFYKFKINNAFSFAFNSIELFSVENNHSIIISQYDFASDYQRLPFSLRGPPQLV